MGMAASQARYLALVARKSNCEYEGQQINQARTALSNQSANLFNQMLGLQVPVPPSTQDFTTTQYSYSDGINASTISSWQQLSTSNPDYNYIVTHYYYTDRYTGSQKKLSDPQVQFSSLTPSSLASIDAAFKAVSAAKATYDAAVATREQQEADMSKVTRYYKFNEYSGATCTEDTSTTPKTYKLTPSGATTPLDFKSYDPSDTSIPKEVHDFISSFDELNSRTDLYYYANSSATPPVFQVAYDDDLSNLVNSSTTGATSLSLYDAEAYDVDAIKLKADKTAESAAEGAYKAAVLAYEALGRPTYVGNSELTYLESLTPDQETELKQVLQDMQEQGINASIANCFSSSGSYLGGVYTFKLNGTTYYTTYSDLYDSYMSGTGNNQIDGQLKLSYYNASYVSTKIEETEEALLETDGNGRFTSVRFANDTVTYTLNMETVTDEVAYQDAMNQFYYDNAIYDKTVQDINAKTSIIQQEDQQLELRLKQLDTEQNALSTEMEAVQKIVKDNVDSSFKTFNG